jgi:hypothetical protein
VWAIVAVGILDVAVTTYISHEEMFDTSQNVISRTGQLVAPPIVENQLLLPDLDADSNLVAVRRNNVVVVARDIKAILPRRVDRRLRPQNIIAAVVPLKSAQPVGGCQAVSYPFIGDEYVVEVTDNTSCLTQVASRYRRDHFIAQFVPRRYRW